MPKIVPDTADGIAEAPAHAHARAIMKEAGRVDSPGLVPCRPAGPGGIAVDVYFTITLAWTGPLAVFTRTM